MCSSESVHYCGRIIPKVKECVASIHNSIGHLALHPLYVAEKSLKILTGTMNECMCVRAKR